MQSYRDNPFSDSRGDMTEPGAAAHHLDSSNQISQGYPGVPLNQGDYRNVPTHSQTDLPSNMGQQTSNSQWDSSRYNQGSTWVAEQEKQTRRSKFVVIAGVVALVIIIAVSVSVGVVVGKKNSSNNNRAVTNGNSNTTGVPNPDAVTQSNPNDPSTFQPNSLLHNSFYGFAYTPVGSQLPNCGNTQAAVIQDIQLLSQLTTNVRLYGADCNQSALVLEAIKQTKVNMTVWLGNYPIATDNGAAYIRQRDEIKLAIQNYGVDNIGGVTVGNEFMLNYLNANGATDPNSAVGNTGAQMLIGFIQDTISMLSGMNLPKHIPVGNSDAGAYFNNEVLAAVEYGMSNVHPWFANVSAQMAANWTTQFFNETNVAAAQQLPNNPEMYIAETGWPTQSSDAGNANNGASDASEANLQIFLDTFVCQSNSQNIKYFFFEFADEEWKDVQFGGVEGHWGLFNQNRTLKNINIPVCQPPVPSPAS